MTDANPRAAIGGNVQHIKRLISYDPSSGVLKWLDRPIEMFKTKRSFSTWNARYAGQEAFTAINDSGYRHGQILGQKHRAHRLIWALQTGEWPAQFIDHVNGIRSDNSWYNLREVSRSENMRNAALPTTNSSGHIGVHWCRPLSVWSAQIVDEGRSIHLGNFPDKSEAIMARKLAEQKYGYHANHGRQK